MTGAQGTAGADSKSVLSIGSVTTTDLADGAITSDKIADGAITSDKIADGAVDQTKLADDSVTSAKIVDATITGADIAATTIIGGNLANGAVSTAQLADASVDIDKLASNSVNSSKIVDLSVATDDVANLAIDNGKLAADAVTSAKILDSTIVIGDIDQSVWAGNVHCAAASLPAAGPSNEGYLCVDTDDNGGTLYRSDGSSWEKAARGVTESPTPPSVLQESLIKNYPSGGNPTTLSPTGHTATVARVFPFTVGGDITVNRVNIRTNAACANVLRLGIYDSSGTLIWTSGVLSTVAGFLALTANPPVTLSQGSQYYFATTNNNMVSASACYTVTPALTGANPNVVPRWGTVPTAAGAMPASIDPTSINEAAGGFMAYVVLSNFTN